MHTWPALRYLKAAMVSAAFSASASANTTTGEWPPSSMVVRFMPLAASAARCLPTGIEPVNEILRAANLARRSEHREIPRRECRHDADRLLHDELPRSLGAPRHDAAVGAAAFLGIPLDDVGRGDHLDARFGVDLALLLHQRLGDRL